MTLTQKRYIIALSSIATLVAVSAIGQLLSSHRLQHVTLPDHTLLYVTIEQALATDRNKPGDHFQAVTSEPLLFNGATLIPQGAHVDGIVVDARPPGRPSGLARLQLVLQRIEVPGKAYVFLDPSSKQSTASSSQWNWTLIAGPVAALLTARKDIHLTPETQLIFQLAAPLTVDAKE
jgi:hypothetical protein